jgi:hypothetical protein
MDARALSSGVAVSRHVLLSRVGDSICKTAWKERMRVSSRFSIHSGRSMEEREKTISTMWYTQSNMRLREEGSEVEGTASVMDWRREKTGSTMESRT